MKSVMIITIFELLSKRTLTTFIAIHGACVPFHHNASVLKPVLVSAFPVTALKFFLFIHVYSVLPRCQALPSAKGIRRLSGKGKSWFQG